MPGHAAVGADVVDASRALTVVGASDGTGSSIIVGYNSSLASKFSVRDDGLTTITNNATVGGTLAITGNSTANSINLGGRSLGSGGTPLGVNFSSATTNGMQINDTNSGNLGGFLGFYSGSGAGTLRANIQNANNAGMHLCLGTSGTVSFGSTSYVAANALDDYEEGTWTPDLRNADNANTFTLEEGFYTKVGNRVFAQFRCDYGNTGGGGGIQIRNLPFSINQNFSCVGLVAVNGGSMSGSNKQYAVFASSGTTMQIYNGGSISSETYSFLSGSLHYITNS